MQIKRQSGRRIYILLAHTCAPMSFGITSIRRGDCSLRSYKELESRITLLHWSEKVLRKKKAATVQVSDSLPCCWRETSLFSDLDPEQRPVHPQHLIFNSSVPLLGTEIGSAEVHSLGIVQPGQAVTEYKL